MPDHDARVRRIRPIALGAVVVGVVLIVASFLVPGRALSRARWSDEQASEYQQAALRLHELSHAAEDDDEHGPSENIRDELAHAQAKFDQIRAQLEQARQAPNHAVALLRWVGVATTLAGVVAYFAASDK